jgi:hypothetical protein
MSCIDPLLQLIYRCFKKKDDTYQPMINMSINGCENIYITSEHDMKDNALEIDNNIAKNELDILFRKNKT